MNVGPSALGSLLVQRLDAVLGTTLAQHAHLMTSARARAVSQPAPTARSRAVTTPTDPRQSIQPVQQPHDNTRRPTLPDADRGGLAIHAAHTRLSHAARLILTLLAQTPERAPTLVSHQPLWPPMTVSTSVAALVAALTHTLAHTVAKSGMFYESHLLALARGRYPATLLALEPQAQLPDAAAVDPARFPQALRLIRQQLDVLAYQQFCWQGHAWPGVPLDWQIRRDKAHPSPGSGLDAPACWHTRLFLQHPEHGAIDAQLTLTGESLALRLVASDVANSLRDRLPVLCQRYARLGFVVSQIQVSESPMANQADTP